MLGHRLYATLRDRFETYVTVRAPAAAYGSLELFEPARLIDGIDAGVDADLRRALEAARPDAVVNCVGIIKQLPQAEDPVVAIGINALLPHRLAAICRDAGARLVHLSTDCVFSGEKGHYTEDDLPDPRDLYGRSKLHGEVASPGAVTVRTSMIGREIGTRHGLVEWFLSQRGGRVSGYRRAIYTGFTTAALSRALADLIERHRTLTGLWHVSSDPIDKFALLGLVNEAFACGTTLEAEDAFHCDRSLDSSRYRRETGFVPPSWRDMIEEMRDDRTPYGRWRIAT
jgi:dTDP-4-dehydrorhamnose reductase